MATAIPIEMDNPAAQCEGASDGLFVYGTLAPGQVNHHVLAGVTGDWQRASLRGVLHEEGWGAEFGCPGIVPSADGETVAGYLFLSRELGNLWATLDAFEGDGYERVLVPVTLDQGGERLAYVYALRVGDGGACP